MRIIKTTTSIFSFLLFHFYLSCCFKPFVTSPCSPHPRTPFIPRIIQSLACIGKQFRSWILQVEEVAIWVIRAAWSKRASLVGTDIESLAGASQQLTTIHEQVPELAIRAVTAPHHPAPSPILRILHTVLLRIDTSHGVFRKCGFQLPGEALIRGICYGKHIHTILFQSVAELPVCVGEVRRNK